MFHLAYRVFEIIIINLIWWPTFLNQEISYLKIHISSFLKKKKLMSRRFGSYGPDFLQGHS